MVKVSVIIPVYNSGVYLRTCLDSVLNQSLEEIEVIAIDDASTDNSLAILKDYQQRYPKLRVLHNQVNLGQGKTRNIGLAAAQGDYISFVDSDDYIQKDMLQSMYACATKDQDIDVVSTSIMFVKDDYYRHEFIPNHSRGRIIDVIHHPAEILNETPSCCDKLFKKTYIKDKRFLDTLWEDAAFSYSSLFNAQKIGHLDDINFFYRKSMDKGVSAKGFNFNPQVFDVFKVTDYIKNETIKSGRYELLKEEITYVLVKICLQRVSEIFHWNIRECDKEKLCLLMNREIENKCGDWQSLDQDILSSYMGIVELDKFKTIVNANKRGCCEIK